MSGAETYGAHVIWRFDIPISDFASALVIPPSAKVINVGIDGKTAFRNVTAWVLLPVDDQGNPCSPQPRQFWVHGTGHPIPSGRRHVGTCYDPPAGDTSPFVWHVFEQARP